MPYHLIGRSHIPVPLHTAHQYESDDEKKMERSGQDSGEAPTKPHRTKTRQPGSSGRENPDFPRFHAPGMDIPVLNQYPDGKRESTVDAQHSATGNHLLAGDAISHAEGKEIGGLQSKAFGGHDPNSLIRVGNEMFTTLQDPEMVQMGKDNQEMKNRLLCKRCSAYDAAVVFLPCGHLVCCPGCVTRYNIRECISCKESIERCIHVHDEERGE